LPEIQYNCHSKLPMNLTKEKVSVDSKPLSWLKLLGVLAMLFWLTHATDSKAQGKTKVIQFSGVIAGGDSLYGIRGASVYVPKAGRGTSTNDYGYFSLPVLPGDSVVISSLGYQKQHFLIPKTYEKENYSVIVEMMEDAHVLPEVRVFPYPTEEIFKEAFLALRLPQEQKSAAEKNLNPEIMRRIFENTPMSAEANHRHYMNTYNQQQIQRQQVTTNPLLNPFAWYQIINGIKNGDFKKK
jgi:hypothetical protein